MKDSLFSGRAIIIAVTAVLLLLALSALSRGYKFPSPISGKSDPKRGAYSVSAIGYAGFYDTLKRLGRPVGRSFGSPLAQTGAEGTILIIDPDQAHLSSPDLKKTLTTAPRVLLVLPKWRGRPDSQNRDWIDQAERVPLPWAQRTLELIDPNGRAARRNWPEHWTFNEIGLNPVGRDMIQLVRSDDLKPIVAMRDGILLGEMTRGRQTVWVLADPDLLANHGLHLGTNALFMVRALDRLHGLNRANPKALIVFDETVHGLAPPQGSPFRLLFRFPFVIFALLAVLAAALAACAGSGRFGPPRRPAPILGFGKAGLIDNAARLLDYSGHQAVTLKRYARMILTQTARALHAPRGLSDSALPAWLDRIGQNRGVSRSCADLLRDMGDLTSEETDDLSRLYENARGLYLWKGELLK